MDSLKFIETIRVINGNIQNLPYHEKRIVKTCDNFKFSFDFNIFKNITISPLLLDEELRLRIIYSENYVKYDLTVYKRRIIKSLKIVENNNIEYNYKFENRAELNCLVKNNGEHDDILIVKNGFVTDTSFSNIVLVDNNNKLITPSTYLLNGIMRQKLINEKIIFEEKVTINDLGKYKGIFLINSMNNIQDNKLLIKYI